MIKKGLIVLIAVFCLMSCFACNSGETQTSETMDADSGKEVAETAYIADNTAENQPAEATAAEQTEGTEDVIKKVTGASDDTGIYSIVVTLSNKAADKGVVEMVYNGPVGSAQENSVVCTFRIEYEKNTSGTFEIKTFYNGDVYQNFHGKAEVKVENTFGAAVRGGDVTITYTPDGGEARQVYYAAAAEFR